MLDLAIHISSYVGFATYDLAIENQQSEIENHLIGGKDPIFKTTIQENTKA